MPRRTSRIPASEEIQAASADTEALAETGAAETEVDSSSEWTLEYDRKTGHFYHFNTRTGESEWVEEEEEEDGKEEEEGVETDSGQGRTVGEGKERRGREREEVVGSERAYPLGFTAKFVFDTCCCECPFALLEATLRAPLYLGGGFLLFLRALVTGNHTIEATQWRLWIREGLLFLASSLSLLFPGLVLYVYRGFHPEAEEWDLAALPTLLGNVDPRRFYSFSYGQGSLASNVAYNAEMGSLDSWGDTILYPPKSLSGARFDHHRLSALSYSAYPGDDEEDGISLWEGNWGRQRLEQRLPHEEWKKLKEENHRLAVGGV